MNGRGEPATNVPTKPLSNIRSSRRKSLPTSGWTVAISASIFPAQSAASAVGQPAGAPSPGTSRAATAASTACSSRLKRRSARRGPRPIAVVRKANGKLPASASSPPPMRPRLRNLRLDGFTLASLAPLATCTRSQA